MLADIWRGGGTSEEWGCVEQVWEIEKGDCPRFLTWAIMWMVMPFLLSWDRKEQSGHWSQS